MKRSMTFSFLVVILTISVAWGYQGEYLFMINWDGMRYDAIDQGLPQHLLDDLAPEGIFFENICNAWHTITSPGHANFFTGNPNIYPNTAGEDCERLGAGGGKADKWHLTHYYPSLMETYVKERGDGPADSLLAWVFGNLGNNYGWGYSRHPDYPDPTPYTAVHAARKIRLKIYDAQLWDSIRTVLDTHQPDIFHVDFHNVDTYGHWIPDSGLAAYHRAIHRVDSITYEILHDYIANSPKYAGKTNVLITSDHGRHSDGINNGLLGHGCDCDGCRRVMGLLWGPDFKEGMTVSEQLYQTDFAHTFAHILGLKAPHARTSRIHTEWLEDPEPENWSPQNGGGKPISDDDLTNSSPDIAIAEEGRVHAVWCEDCRVIKYRHYDNGYWSTTQTLATAGPEELLKTPRVAVKDSKVAVGWERFKEKSPGFQSWYFETVVSFNSGQSWSRILGSVFSDAVIVADLIVEKDFSGHYLLVAAAHAPDRGDRSVGTRFTVRKGRSASNWQTKLSGKFVPSRPRYLDLNANGPDVFLALEYLWYPHINIEVVGYYSSFHGESWSWTGPDFITDENACGYYLHDYSPSGLIIETGKGASKQGWEASPQPEPALSSCYPNPFNPATTIGYSISEAGYVRLEVFNLKGQEVETLVEEHQLPGSYEITWQAEKYSSGVYFYKLTAGDYTQTRRMLLVK